MENLQRDISVITGVFVQNEKDEVLFVRMPKWGDTWGIPGGHVDRGETLEAGALRELQEETGLEAESAEYVGYTEMIDPKDFHKPKHFVSFQFRVFVKGRPELRLEEREIVAYRWMTLEDARKQDDLNSIMIETLRRMSAESLREDHTDYKDKWMRAQADYQNLQKEIAAKRAEWAAWSEWQVLEEFMPVYDHFKKAFVAHGRPEDGWAKGIEYIMKQFEDVLKLHGIEQIETVGKKFNPALHEVLGEEESDKEAGMIVKELDGGYKKGEKVLKVAKVIVAK